MQFLGTKELHEFRRTVGLDPRRSAADSPAIRDLLRQFHTFRRRRTVGVEALEVHGPVGLEFENRVHWVEDGEIPVLLQLREVNARVGDYTSK